MSQPLDDEQVEARIDELEQEERRLRRDESEAADDAGQDPDGAEMRDATIERYLG